MCLNLAMTAWLCLWEKHFEVSFSALKIFTSGKFNESVNLKTHNRFQMDKTFLPRFNKPNKYTMSFVFTVIDRFKNKFNNHSQQFLADSPNTTTNLNPYLTLPYIGTPSI